MINHTAIITPTTKADNGEHMIFQERTFCQKESFLKKISLENIPDLFQRGTEIAASRGLILVDTNMNLVKQRRSYSFN
jgi:phosphoribosylaminoimidazole-succinocarboxamide synthase